MTNIDAVFPAIGKLAQPQQGEAERLKDDFVSVPDIVTKFTYGSTSKPPRRPGMIYYDCVYWL